MSRDRPGFLVASVYGTVGIDGVAKSSRHGLSVVRGALYATNKYGTVASSASMGPLASCQDC